jgi:cyclohexanecarboxylate-CoA ligase
VAVADVAAPDGHGGIRLMGRAADRVGGVLMIPVSDVESELLKNPGADEVALIGYPGENDEELAYAVIVPATEPPITLDQLRKLRES